MTDPLDQVADIIYQLGVGDTTATTTAQHILTLLEGTTYETSDPTR